MMDPFVYLKSLKFHLSMLKISSLVKFVLNYILWPISFMSCICDQSANSRYSTRTTCGSILKVCTCKFLATKAFGLTQAIILALKRVLETEELELEIIINPKTTDDGFPIIQVRHTPSIHWVCPLKSNGSSKLLPAQPSSTSGMRTASTFRAHASYP